MDSQAVSVCPSCRRSFERSFSGGRTSNAGSLRRSSFNLSQDGSLRIPGDIPDEYVAQAGDSGDRVVDDNDHELSSTSFDEGIGTTSKQDSFRRLSRSSWQMGSISFSDNTTGQILEELGNGIADQAGDSGDMLIREDQHDGRSLRFQVDNMQIVENRTMNLPDDASVQSHCLHNHVANYSSPVSPLTLDIVPPLPTDAILHSREKYSSQSVLQISRILSQEVKQYKLRRPLDYLSYLIHLAVFGILGVLTRYSLEKLFGPGILGLTSDESPLYPDLIANMVGSFLMGWFGVVFKGDVLHFSEHLAIGLTTGYMGSLTTFSGWNQKMVELSSKGHWVFAVAGILIGMWVVDRSTDMGVWTATCLRGRLLHALDKTPHSPSITPEHWRIDRPSRHVVEIMVMLLILGCLWGLSGALFRKLLDDVDTGAILWLGCLVGPPGVWLRWYLARLNGQGVGKKGYVRWLPIGTLAANVLAACIMAALATINKVVNTRRCEIIVSAAQLGFLGCLSTVSTFAVEVYAMRHSERDGRALAYVAATFIPSFAMGTLLYSVPVWTKHYH